ncbi:MAG: hypothetical protein ACI8X5_000548 [Planctomycetota bacterium]
MLSGGLANLNIRVGAARALRILRQDVSALQKEAQRLVRSWRNFRTPYAHQVGTDSLLIDFVEHKQRLNDALSGVIAFSHLEPSTICTSTATIGLLQSQPGHLRHRARLTSTEDVNPELYPWLKLPGSASLVGDRLDSEAQVLLLLPTWPVRAD